MNKGTLGFLLLGSLIFSACGQSPAPDSQAAGAASPVASTTPAEAGSTAIFEQTLSDLRAAQARVAAGEAAPTDAQGRAIDLTALIAQYEGHLKDVDALSLQGGITSQDLYVTTFRTIVADDNFRSNYNNWRRNFPGYNWGNDGCSGPARATGYADNFFWPCVQHDFGYRNNRRAGQHNENTRVFIDVAFLRHMNQLCSHYAVVAKPACYYMANVFYNGVRFGGWSSFY